MFLPSIWRLLLLLVLTLAGCGGAHRAPSTEPAPGSPATVVWGTGEPEPAVLEMFTRIVNEQLTRLEVVFPRRPVHPFFVFVHASRDSMPESLTANLHADAPGFAILGTHQVHLVLGEIRRHGTNPNNVIAHELVHELLDQHVAPNGRLIPRWFHEGLAQVLAGDTYLGVSEDDLVWRAGTHGLLPFYRLRDSFPQDVDELHLAYAQSYSYVGYLARSYGVGELLAVARATDDLTPLEGALVGRVRRSTLELEDDWHSYILHGSGAPWRVAMDSCFSLCLVLALPVLVLALMRRLRSESKAAAHLRRAEWLAAQAAEANPDPDVQPPPSIELGGDPEMDRVPDQPVDPVPGEPLDDDEDVAEDNVG